MIHGSLNQVVLVKPCCSSQAPKHMRPACWSWDHSCCHPTLAPQILHVRWLVGVEIKYRDVRQTRLVQGKTMSACCFGSDLKDRFQKRVSSFHLESSGDSSWKSTSHGFQSHFRWLFGVLPPVIAKTFSRIVSQPSVPLRCSCCQVRWMAVVTIAAVKSKKQSRNYEINRFGLKFQHFCHEPSKAWTFSTCWDTLSFALQS